VSLEDDEDESSTRLVIPDRLAVVFGREVLSVVVKVYEVEVI